MKIDITHSDAGDYTIYSVSGKRECNLAVTWDVGVQNNLKSWWWRKIKNGSVVQRTGLSPSKR